MDIKEFEKTLDVLVDKEFDLLVTKGKEYSGTQDRLANFKNLAIDLGLLPQQILWVYLKKHLDSICSYIREGKTFSTESIQGRIMDARNYLALLYAMIQEIEGVSCPE